MERYTFNKQKEKIFRLVKDKIGEKRPLTEFTLKKISQDFDARSKEDIERIEECLDELVDENSLEKYSLDGVVYVLPGTKENHSENHLLKRRRNILFVGSVYLLLLGIISPYIPYLHISDTIEYLPGNITHFQLFAVMLWIPFLIYIGGWSYYFGEDLAEKYTPSLITFLKKNEIRTLIISNFIVFLLIYLYSQFISHEQITISHITNSIIAGSGLGAVLIGREVITKRNIKKE